jgi:hypothetical protein
MQALKIAAFAALNIALLAGAVAAADSPEAVATKIRFTLLDGEGTDHRPLAFSCAIESQGIPVATINTMQASLVVSRQLPDIRVTCSRPGYRNFVMTSDAPITKDIDARAWAMPASQRSPLSEGEGPVRLVAGIPAVD